MNIQSFSLSSNAINEYNVIHGAFSQMCCASGMHTIQLPDMSVVVCNSANKNLVEDLIGLSTIEDICEIDCTDEVLKQYSGEYIGPFKGVTTFIDIVTEIDKWTDNQIVENTVKEKAKFISKLKILSEMILGFYDEPDDKKREIVRLWEEKMGTIVSIKEQLSDLDKQKEIAEARRNRAESEEDKNKYTAEIVEASEEIQNRYNELIDKSNEAVDMFFEQLNISGIVKRWTHESGKFETYYCLFLPLKNDGDLAKICELSWYKPSASNKDMSEYITLSELTVSKMREILAYSIHVSDEEVAMLGYNVENMYKTRDNFKENGEVYMFTGDDLNNFDIYDELYYIDDGYTEMSTEISIEDGADTTTEEVTTEVDSMNNADDNADEKHCDTEEDNNDYMYDYGD